MLELKLKSMIIFFSLDYWSHVMPTAERSGAQLHDVCLVPEEKLNHFGEWDGMQSCPGRKEVKGNKCMHMGLLS